MKKDFLCCNSWYLRTAASCSSQREHSRQPGEEGTCHGPLACGDRCKNETASSTVYFPTSQLIIQFLRGEQTNLVQSAPLVISVLMRSSWPKRAAMWRGVLPSLSTQSISPPERKRSLMLRIKEEIKWAGTRLTVLNEGLGASEAAVNCCHVKRTLPITALKKMKQIKQMKLKLLVISIIRWHSLQIQEVDGTDIVFVRLRQ